MKAFRFYSLTGYAMLHFGPEYRTSLICLSINTTSESLMFGSPADEDLEL
jgi:hypothetical protein